MQTRERERREWDTDHRAFDNTAFNSRTKDKRPSALPSAASKRLTLDQFKAEQQTAHNIARSVRVAVPVACAVAANMIPLGGHTPPGTVAFYGGMVGYFAVPFVFHKHGMFGWAFAKPDGEPRLASRFAILVPAYGWPWDSETLTYTQYCSNYDSNQHNNDGTSWYDRLKMLIVGLIARWTLGGILAAAVKTVALRLAAIPGLKALSGLMVFLAGAPAF